MSKSLRLVTTLLKYGTLLSTIGFAACVLLQIFARFLLPTAPSWTEEAARIFFVLAVGYAAGLAYRSGEYVQFDFLYQRLSEKGQNVLSIVIDGLTVLLFGLFTVAAVRFMGMGFRESSPSLQFPMAIPFASMVLLGVGVLVYAIARLTSTVSRSAVDGYVVDRCTVDRATIDHTPVDHTPVDHTTSDHESTGRKTAKP